MTDLTDEIATFYDSLASDFDLSSELRWQYSVRDVPTTQVKYVMDHLLSLGFIEIEPDFNDIDETPNDVNDDTLFRIGFGYVGVHSQDSASKQIRDLFEWAESNGFKLDDWSAGLP